MRVIWGLWWTAWTVGTAAGAGLAIVSAPPVGWTVMAGIGAATAWWGRWALTTAASPLVQARTAGVGAAGGLGVLGLSSVGGVPAVLYAGLLLAGAAGVVLPRLRADGLTAVPAPSTDPGMDVDQDALRLVVRAWSYDQLCRAWRTSAHRTGHPDPRLRIQTTAQREILLDEIERRDPAAFSSWLAADPSAGSDPRRHRPPDRDAA